MLLKWIFDVVFFFYFSVFQERTPGVGMEEEKGREDDGSTGRDVDQKERAKLEEKLSAIEADLEKALQEEDYDKAGKSIKT